MWGFMLTLLLAAVSVHPSLGGISTTTEGLRIVDEVTQYSLSLLEQQLDARVSYGKNLSTIYLSYEAMSELMCTKSHEEVVASMRELGVDMILFTDEQIMNKQGFCPCCTDTDTKLDALVRYWCSVAPILVIFNDRVLGYSHHWRPVYDGIAGIQCWALQGIPVLGKDQIAFMENNGVVRTDIVLNESSHNNLINSIFIQLLFRGLIAVGYVRVAVKSLYIFKMRKATGTRTNKVHQFVLVITVVQGLLFTVLNISGCMHWVSDTCNANIQIMFWTNLFGLSLGTDLLFSAMLKTVSAVLTGLRAAHTIDIAYDRRFLGAAVFVTVADILALFFALVIPTPTTVLITWTLLPIFLFAMQLVVVLILINQTRNIAAILRSASNSLKDVHVSKLQMRLAKQFEFWAKVSLLAALLSCIGAALLSIGTYRRSTVGFLAHVLLLDLAKLLNLEAQINVLKPVTSRKIHHASACATTAKSYLRNASTSESATARSAHER